MNRADVLRMAREARFPVNHPDWADAAVRFAALVAANANAARITAQLENEGLKARIVASGVAERRAVREAVLAEREACAMVAESGFKFAHDGYQIADSIRERSAT